MALRTMFGMSVEVESNVNQSLGGEFLKAPHMMLIFVLNEVAFQSLLLF